jgi:hypothetical protein
LNHPDSGHFVQNEIFNDFYREAGISARARAAIDVQPLIPKNFRASLKLFQTIFDF